MKWNLIKFFGSSSRVSDEAKPTHFTILQVTSISLSRTASTTYHARTCIFLLILIKCKQEILILVYSKLSVCLFLFLSAQMKMSNLIYRLQNSCLRQKAVTKRPSESSQMNCRLHIRDLRPFLQITRCSCPCPRHFTQVLKRWVKVCFYLPNICWFFSSIDMCFGWRLGN